MMPHSCSRALICLCTCILILVLSACGSTPTSGGTSSSARSPIVKTIATAADVTPTTQVVQTQPMPQTQTSCPLPLADTARAAVMRPLALGSDPAIAYIFNTGTQANPSFAELKWYDTANSNKKVIVHLLDDYIESAQVSSDGQWLLFVTDYPQYSALQLVRMDGQGLQTLYCATRSTIQGVQWSPDQSQVILSTMSVSGLFDVYLLKLSSGQLLPELVQLNNASTGYIPRTWADNSRVYLAGVPNNQDYQRYGIIDESGLYLLNTSNGPHQTPNNLHTVIPPASSSGCWDFDSDYNTTTLVTSRCTGTFSSNDIRSGNLQGPSSVAKGSVTGGQLQTIYQNSAEAITQVRFLGYSSSMLLFTINSVSLSTPGVPVDSSHNGIWKMNANGSSVTELASESPNYIAELNLFSQYPWANVSRRGGAFYAVQVSSLGNGATPPTYLEYGSASSGNLTSFAFANECAGSLAIAGWTTM